MSTDDPGGPSPSGTRPAGVVAVPRPVPRSRAARLRAVAALVALTVALVALTVALVLTVRAQVGEAFYIPSGSMEPGLLEGDRILVEKLSGASSQPRRGDVVVFEDPGGWLGGSQPGDPVAQGLRALGVLPSTGHLVKRVVGVAGDVVECCDDQGRLVVNGVGVEEGYLVAGAPCAGPMIAGCRWRAGPVPADRLFVMGDHRAASGDSTTHLCTAAVTECTNDPYVDTSLVVGRLWRVVWPLGRWGGVPNGRQAFGDVPARPTASPASPAPPAS